MDLLRAVARPLLAASFVVDGIDAIARPKRHVEKMRKVTPTLERVGVPPVMDSDAALATRALGAVSVAAGVGLATGRAPRTSAAVLAAINVPLAVVNHPVWAVKGKEARLDAVSGLLRRGALGAGLLLASVDRAGRPSLAWRAANKREHRQAIQAAKDAVRQRYEGEPA